MLSTNAAEGLRRRWQEPAVLASAFALSLLGGAPQGDGTLAAPPVAAYLFAAVSCGALILRRRRPFLTMAVTAASGVVAPAAGLWLTPLLLAPATIAACSLTTRSARHTFSAVGLSSAALLVASAPPLDALSWQDASRMLSVGILPLAAGALGQAARDRRLYLEAIEDRARRAEETRESEARRRVADERLRIARELHDLVAHQITLANAQANVAAQSFDAHPDQARTSLRELVATTRGALDEMRATVGLLRRPEETDDPDEQNEPAPGLAQLPALIESFRRAGVDVSRHDEGRPQPVSAGLDLVAYRIVQEALTNVTKHAAHQQAAVRLCWRPDGLTITVTDGPDPTLTQRRESPRRQPTSLTGYGLVGMHERVSTAGGRLRAGPAPGGGFSVVADLPLPTAQES